MYAGEGAFAVVYEGELVFHSVKDRFDPVADAAGCSRTTTGYPDPVR